ncbi:MAG: hydrogenase expression protein HupG [Methanosarcina sp.]|nr:MAG: hydrogenase expression protein HupG [Methanosarcina sp.]
MIRYYLLIMGIFLALGLIPKSHRLMNALAAGNGLLHLVMSCVALFTLDLPVRLGASLYLDHLNLYVELITALGFSAAAFYARGYTDSLMEAGELDPKNLKTFYLAFNLLLVTSTVALFSDNLALFWIFAELTTVCAAMLVAILSARENIDAALKYVFIVSGAMLFAFLGLIFLFTLSEQTLGEGTLNWTVLAVHASEFSPALLLASFTFMFIGFGAKAGVAPFHTWLPDDYARAPSVSAILSGLMQNLGIYGIIRMYALLRESSAAPQASSILIAAGDFSIALASFSMLQQRNLKRLIAFSSVEHMGLLLIGIGIGTPLALFWTLYYMLVHVLVKETLLFSAGILHRQYRSNMREDMKDVFKLQPRAAWGLILGSIAIVGMPPFPLFPAKFFILLESAEVSPYLTLAVLLMLILAAASFANFLLKAFSKVTVEEENEKEEHRHITRTPAGTGGDVKEPSTGKAGYEKSRLPGQYMVKNGMRVPTIFMLALALALGFYFPDSLRDLLDAIVFELGYV